MSCWVVPAIAAELWGVPVIQVLEQIRSGRVPSKTELGFLLVDVAPNSPKIETPRPIKAIRDPHPPTFVIRPAPARPAKPAPVPVAVGAEDDSDEVEEGEFSWHSSRAAARTARRPPQLAAA